MKSIRNVRMPDHLAKRLPGGFKHEDRGTASPDVIVPPAPDAQVTEPTPKKAVEAPRTIVQKGMDAVRGISRRERERRLKGEKK